MAVMWKIGEGTVADVRAALPAESRGAYTTIQTVLNRLAERNLLDREMVGNTITYRTRVTEADYLTSSLRRTLAGASEEARSVAIARLAEEDPAADDEEASRRRGAR